MARRYISPKEHLAQLLIEATDWQLIEFARKRQFLTASLQLKTPELRVFRELEPEQVGKLYATLHYALSTLRNRHRLRITGAKLEEALKAEKAMELRDIATWVRGADLIGQAFYQAFHTHAYALLSQRTQSAQAWSILEPLHALMGTPPQPQALAA
jgi:hypothetical protein